MPNPITIILETQADLTRYFNQFDLRPASKLIPLLRAIIRAYPVCNVYVSSLLEIIPLTYMYSPTNLARYLQKITDSPVQCFYSEGTLHVRVSESPQPRSFKAQVLQALQTNRRYDAPNEQIPTSYRMNPALLRKYLQTILGNKIEIIQKEKSIVWKIAQSAVNR